MADPPAEDPTPAPSLLGKRKASSPATSPSPKAQAAENGITSPGPAKKKARIEEEVAAVNGNAAAGPSTGSQAQVSILSIAAAFPASYAMSKRYQDENKAGEQSNQGIRDAEGSEVVNRATEGNQSQDQAATLQQQQHNDNQNIAQTSGSGLKTTEESSSHGKQASKGEHVLALLAADGKQGGTQGEGQHLPAVPGKQGPGIEHLPARPAPTAWDFVPLDKTVSDQAHLRKEHDRERERTRGTRRDGLDEIRGYHLPHPRSSWNKEDHSRRYWDGRYRDDRFRDGYEAGRRDGYGAGCYDGWMETDRYGNKRYHDQKYLEERCKDGRCGHQHGCRAERMQAGSGSGDEHRSRRDASPTSRPQQEPPRPTGPKYAPTSNPTVKAWSSLENHQLALKLKLKLKSKSNAHAKNDTAALQKDDNGEDGFEKVMSRDERRKKKKEESVAKAKQEKTPYVGYFGGVYGQNKTTLASVRDSFLYMLTGGQGVKWLEVRNRESIDHLVILFVPGLLPSHLGAPPNTLTNKTCEPFPIGKLAGSKVPYIQKIFATALPTRGPGDNQHVHSAISQLLSLPLPAKEKERRQKLRQRQMNQKMKEIEDGAAGDVPKYRYDPSLYCLTPNQMIENEYPMPSYMPISAMDYVKGDGGKIKLGDEVFVPGKQGGGEEGEVDVGLKEGWRETRRARGVPEGGRYPVLAIDCEMVDTTEGNELARVTALDFHSGKMVYDEYVKPAGTVTDYKTQFSGVTEAHLATATKSLAQIQDELLERPNLITSNTIILGHSLENDFRALKLQHPLCIDTAVIFPSGRGRSSKPALRWLCKQHLKRDIQNRGASGHDSAEDARACLDLLKRKCEDGPEFGEQAEDTETLFERLSRHAATSSKPGKSSLVCDSGSQLNKWKATRSVPCADDFKVAEAVVENVPSYNITYARFLGLSVAQGWTNQQPTPTPADPETPSGPSPLDLALSSFNIHLETIHRSLPAGTIFCLVTGGGNPLPYLALQNKHRDFNIKYQTLGPSACQKLPDEQKWTPGDERALEGAVETARSGMAMFCVKR